MRFSYKSEDLKILNHLKNLYEAKELSLWYKLRFSNAIFFVTQCRRPQIFQTMNYVRSNSLSLKYQGFSSSDCQDIEIRKFKLKKISFRIE